MSANNPKPRTLIVTQTVTTTTTTTLRYQPPRVFSSAQLPVNDADELVRMVKNFVGIVRGDPTLEPKMTEECAKALDQLESEAANPHADPKVRSDLLEKIMRILRTMNLTGTIVHQFEEIAAAFRNHCM
jgi:hypothetical protein